MLEVISDLTFGRNFDPRYSVCAARLRHWNGVGARLHRKDGADAEIEILIGGQ